VSTIHLLGVRTRAARGAPVSVWLAGGGLVAMLAVGLLDLDRLPLTVCTFKAFTGFACMTCGATRALGLLFHGDLAAALAMNPLATVAMLAVVPWALADLALLPRGRALGLDLAPALARALRVAVVVLVGANWVYLLAVGR
jgi:hypothetical protein